MKANTVITSSGAEVYENSIFRIADEYIATLSNDAEESQKLMQKPAIFRGLLKEVYLQLFKTGSEERKCNSKIDYGDIDSLDSIWDIYAKLCYRYGQAPTIINFCSMVGVHRDTISDWLHGRYRQSSAHIRTIKKWMEECEGALLDGAIQGNPGCMFALKCNYGYREAGYIYEQNTSSLEIETPRQIAQRRAGDKPDFPAVIE